MIEKFDYILLPPEAFHLNLKDTLSFSRKWLTNVSHAILKIKKKNQVFLIKYRSDLQKKHFPIEGVNIVGCGTFIDYCHQGTIVIGPPGTACIEALLNDIKYYTYDYAQLFSSSNPNKASFNRLTEILYTAKNTNELLDNIHNKHIYRVGYSKKNLLHKNGSYLYEIVNCILSK